MGKGGTRGWTAAAQLALYRQPFAVEPRPDRTCCRPILGRRSTLQIGAHLQRSPARMRPPHRKTPLDELICNRLRMMQRCPRAVEQTLNACLLIARKPLVPDPPAHAEAPTRDRKWFFVLLGRYHKAHPLIHGTGLRPSHRQGPPRRSVDLLPMSPVYSVTHVAGLDPSPVLPHKGGGSRPIMPLPPMSVSTK